MLRDPAVLLQDISTAAEKILDYTAGMDRRTFLEDAKTVDAVLRNLTVIGEAVKKLPTELRQAHSEIDWRRIAGFRDIVVHDYATIDLEIVWDVVTTKVPELATAMARLSRPSS